MRVCIDGIVFENDHQRGIQRYFRGIVDHLPDGFEVEMAMGNRPRAALPARCRVVHPMGPSRALPRGLRRAAARLRQSRSEHSADVFHSSYYTAALTPVPSVLTVQDMIVERFTDYFHSRWADEEVRRKRASIEAATILITGSDDTSAELKAFFPKLADRVMTVHHGVDHIPAAPGPRAGATGEPYALFVGDRGGYKNFRTVLEALGGREWPADLPLVVIGSEPRENERALVDRLGVRIRFVGRVDEAMLRQHYSAASATIVPSLAEGFGFPVLEAQRAGCPVVCSDIGVFREIAGDSAVFFDPVRPDDLGQAVARARDSADAARLSAAGLANSARFTWERSAALTAEAYRRAAALR